MKRHVANCGKRFRKPICDAHCYSDFWRAYRAVIPSGQHTRVGIRSGQTAHVERFNNTLRQRLARFVRSTLSFSKSVLMHEACLRLFFHRYNCNRAVTLYPLGKYRRASSRFRPLYTIRLCDCCPPNARITVRRFLYQSSIPGREQKVSAVLLDNKTNLLGFRRTAKRVIRSVTSVFGG